MGGKNIDAEDRHASFPLQGVAAMGETAAHPILVDDTRLAKWAGREQYAAFRDPGRLVRQVTQLAG